METPRRHYAHAPITEAVIALGFELPNEIALNDLAAGHATLKQDYPIRDEHFQVQVRVEAAEREGKVTPAELLGYHFASEDRKRLILLTLKDFTFSQLAPYDRWETLRSQAKQAWNLVELFIHPQKVTRASVRFINRIDIPIRETQHIDLDDYFRTAPKIAPELPQELKTYFIRLELPMPGSTDNSNRVLIITETPAAAPNANVISAVLDIDAIVQNMSTNAAEAWAIIEELRDVKNFAFEACITDGIRNLIR